MDYTWTVYPRFLKLPHYEYLVEQKYTLRSHELPKGMGYTIFITDNGRAVCKSNPGSCGGVRYYHFYGADAEHRAMDHGLKWAQRKIKEANRCQ